MASEMQGNVVDLCPVGALTSKPYQNKARPWELTKTESIDVMDALGSAIRVDARGREVMRILPRVNEAVNEEWISDKTRHIVDGLRTQRLDRPYVRKGGRLQPASWAEALAAVAARLKAAPAGRIGAIAGDLAGVEEMFALKALLTALGSSNTDMQGRGALHPVHGRASYIFNPGIAGIDEADRIVLVGANPRHDATVLNARIRKRWLRGDISVSNIGEAVDLTYAVTQLGASAAALATLAEDATARSARPLVIVGAAAFERPDGAALLASAARTAIALGGLGEGWNGFGVLHTRASMVGGLDIGFVPGEGGLTTERMIAAGGVDVLVNLGADEVSVAPGAFVVYIGTHGDQGAQRADVILPGSAYTEKSATYVNTEGRAQMTNRAGFAPGEAKEDWAILRALSELVGQRLPFDTLGALRQRLYAAHPHLAMLDSFVAADPTGVAALAALPGDANAQPLQGSGRSYYLSNPIARASAVMGQCAALAAGSLRMAAE
jgi:NADH-quinone oxidoreductase subunit G